MGLGDEKLMFGENQLILQAADEAATDTLDFQDVTHSLGIGTDLSLEITVTEDFTGLASGMKVLLQSDEDNGFATSLVTDFQSRTLAVSELVAGASFKFPLPYEDIKRHVRVWFDMISQVAAAGRVTSRIVAGAEKRSA